MAALLISALTLPLLTAVAYALQPESPPSRGLTQAQLGVAVTFLFVMAMGWLLVLALLLLKGSRVGWVLAVATGVSGVVQPGGAGASLSGAVAFALWAAAFVPLLAPESLRWFWRRRLSAEAVQRAAPDLRRPDYGGLSRGAATRGTSTRAGQLAVAVGLRCPGGLARQVG